MNRVMIIGRLGKDPEVRFTNNNKAVASFSIATQEAKDAVEWHRVTAWEKTAELAGEYLRKGSLVGIEGRLQTRKWEKDGETRYATEIVASRIEFLANYGDEKKQPKQKPKPEEFDYGPPPMSDDEDVPF